MNLTIGEVAELPLCAALFDGDDMLAHTPEWRDAVPGAVTYRVRRARLVVSTEEVDASCGAVVGALLEEMDRTARALPHRQALRVAMLAASLRVVVGRDADSTGTSRDVLEHASAGIAARTAMSVALAEERPFAVRSPAVAALVLVQLASNAERHDGATSVVLAAARGTFSIAWRGSSAAASAQTARRRADRQRWGLGFARTAADALGAVLHPPVDAPDGNRVGVLETGLNRLSLPLALLRQGAVHKATRAWDEETALLPGCAPPADHRVTRCVAAATDDPGALVRVEGWCARSARHSTWVAIPPDVVADRARDLLDGMVHERALWDGVPEPARSRIFALAAIVGSMLGADPVRVPGPSWNRRAHELARAFGVTTPVPLFRGAGAVDPRIALFLATELDATLEADGDALHLRIRPDQHDHPLLRPFRSAEPGSIRLG
jgi:hypothetical protein